MAKKAQKNFEEALKALQHIVGCLEQGDIALEESIKNYKEGMDLAAYCMSVLKKAEQEIYVYEQETYKKIEGENWE
ncbi:exodeoxyribonuclease VII small subunit [Cellulosilyticum sp. I15G10I2]|uniref:exodeoxyribonuclease VII small subunit n=1 Tax=Cellulosilyticum sp. I15G10I2 TaxID=1892843 RepID=UPI00085BEF9E|nr:exodeoxyribonuclease VII small subunit [Cellulosilyticum sp. I15G10I2]